MWASEDVVIVEQAITEDLPECDGPEVDLEAMSWADTVLGE